MSGYLSVFQVFMMLLQEKFRPRYDARLQLLVFQVKILRSLVEVVDRTDEWDLKIYDVTNLGRAVLKQLCDEYPSYSPHDMRCLFLDLAANSPSNPCNLCGDYGIYTSN